MTDDTERPDEHPGPLPAPVPGNADVHAQLSEIRSQLAQITASQQRTERELNPPLWKKILRSRWLAPLVVLIVLLLVGGWLYQRLLGDGGGNGEGAVMPPPQTAANAPAIGGDTPTATVIGIYGFVAAGRPGDACAVFTDSGRRQFAADFGATSCQTAVDTLHRRVTNPTAYSNSVVSASDLGGNGDSYRKDTFTVSSCQAAITGGPSLGAFVLTRAPNRTWLVSGHHGEHCSG